MIEKQSAQTVRWSIQTSIFYTQCCITLCGQTNWDEIQSGRKTLLEKPWKSVVKWANVTKTKKNLSRNRVYAFYYFRSLIRSRMHFLFKWFKSHFTNSHIRAVVIEALGYLHFHRFHVRIGLVCLLARRHYDR